MTTRAEEIAAEGPYTVEAFEIKRTLKPQIYFRVVGPTPTGLHSTTQKYAANRLCDRLNAAYKQGQQDRWISVEERLPEPNIEVLVAFADDTVAGTSQWCRVKSPDIMGWLGPAENKGKVITHWMPLPSPSNPEQR